jgi:large subunit ribosomal protein L24e
MVTQKKCSFCGADIEPGTGKMTVKNDGAIRYYCSSKCEKNAVLKRNPHKTEWTENFVSQSKKK